MNIELDNTFFDNRLNGKTYLFFKQDKLLELLEEVDLATQQKIWWQQDSAPPYSHHIVMKYLNNIFHERWIEKYGYIRRLLRSSDLTSSDFFVGLYKKYYLQNSADICRRLEKSYNYPGENKKFHKYLWNAYMSVWKSLLSI